MNTGDRFGRLEVLAFAEADEHGHKRFRCKCTCGATVTVFAYNLLRNNTTSCGCVRRNRLEEDALRISDRKAYLRLIWERYGTLYMPADERAIAKLISNDCNRSWTGLRKAVDE